MNETDIVKEIQVGLGKLRSVRLFRNNVGLYRNPNGQVVRFGLCTGSSDLVGWTTVKITPQMIGRDVAIFTCCEVKKPKEKPTPEQEAFISVVQSAGGIAFVAHSLDEAENKMMNI